MAFINSQVYLYLCHDTFAIFVPLTIYRALQLSNFVRQHYLIHFYLSVLNPFMRGNLSDFIIPYHILTSITTPHFAIKRRTLLFSHSYVLSLPTAPQQCTLIEIHLLKEFFYVISQVIIISYLKYHHEKKIHTFIYTLVCTLTTQLYLIFSLVFFFLNKFYDFFFQNITTFKSG